MLCLPVLRDRPQGKAQVVWPPPSSLAPSVSLFPASLLSLPLQPRGRDCAPVLGVLPGVRWVPYPALAFGLNSLQTTHFGGATCFLLGPASGKQCLLRPSVCPSVRVFGACLLAMPHITKLSEGTNLKAIHAAEQSQSCHLSLLPGLTASCSTLFHLSASHCSPRSITRRELKERKVGGGMPFFPWFKPFVINSLGIRFN